MWTENRKIPLMLDNVPSHHALVVLTHVKIRELPTTSHLHPLDAGIIHNIKREISKKKALYYKGPLDEVFSCVKTVGQENVE